MLHSINLVAGPSRGPLAEAARRAAQGAAIRSAPRLVLPFTRKGDVACRHKSTDASSAPDAAAEAAEAKAAKAVSIAEADEALRQRLLDRDGGSASVATVNGQWEPGMGRETARQMFRVLDQARVNRPGTNAAAGEGESKHWSRRNGY